MMSVIDYNTVICQQFQGVDKSQKRFDIYCKEYSNFFRDHYLRLNNILKEVNNTFINQLFLTKGLLSDITEKQVSLKDKDLNEVISRVSDLIKKIVVLNSTIEDIIKFNLSEKVPQLTITSALVSETIDLLMLLPITFLR